MIFLKRTAAEFEIWFLSYPQHVERPSKGPYTLQRQREDAWIYGSMMAGAAVFAAALCIWA